MRRLGTTAMEARYLPDAYYARMGDAFADRVGGRHWIKYVYADLEGLGDGAGAGFADQMRKTTPHEAAVKQLLASDDVRKVGGGDDPRPAHHALDRHGGRRHRADRRHLGRRPGPAGQEGRAGPDGDR